MRVNRGYDSDLQMFKEAPHDLDINVLKFWRKRHKAYLKKRRMVRMRDGRYQRRYWGTPGPTWLDQTWGPQK